MLRLLGYLLRTKKLWWFFIIVSILSGVLLIGVAIGMYFYFAPSLPKFNSFADYQPKLGSRIYSADNQLLGEFAAERRVVVPFNKIPPLLLKAFVAAEDKRFFVHKGLDYLGILQALLDKFLHPKHKMRGASTITQQVAKSLLISNESYELATRRSLQRKIREAILAVNLEKRLSKHEIIYMYVHQIFLGQQAYGVQAAAEHYFKKNVEDLSIAEMAMLAGLAQRPSKYSPASEKKAALERRKYVLRRMHEDGYITALERQTAEEEPLIAGTREDAFLKMAPFYTEQVRREIIDRYGEQALLEDGLQIYTGINIAYQYYAQQAIEEALFALDKRQGYRGPLLHLDKPTDKTDFVTKYREHLGLAAEEELKPNQDTFYLALIKQVEPLGATLDIAGLPGYLPLSTMRWARVPNPVERFDGRYVESAKERLQVGDIILVKPTTKEELPSLLSKDDARGLTLSNKITTTLNLFRLEQRPIAQGAFLAVDPHTGYILAAVGGFDFLESSYNRATQACREPGSAFKPIVYAAALDKYDYTASTLIDDKPLVFDDPEHALRWKPNNAGLQFRGTLPLRTCLKDSINTPALRVAEAVGIEDILKLAKRFGITTELKRELGTALGSSCVTLFDLLKVYTTINQYGEAKPLMFVRKVLDRYGNVLEDYTDPTDPTISLGNRLNRAYLKLFKNPAVVLDPVTAFLMIRLLKNVVLEGTAVAASKLGLPLSGKTGTTNDSYDAWFMGFTQDLVAGVWIGHDKKDRPLGVAEQGARTALPAWVNFANNALMDYTGETVKRLEQVDFAPPSGAIAVPIDAETGLLARPNTKNKVEEYYRLGTEPKTFTPDKNMANIDEVNLYTE